jgi:hypothetical protein
MAQPPHIPPRTQIAPVTFNVAHFGVTHGLFIWAHDLALIIEKTLLWSAALASTKPVIVE